MTSRPSRPGAVAPTLTGLSLAAGIAREAVDAVPIVKQVLGVVVKILALAEKIDKDRDALYALADKSAQFARRVQDILGDQEPDPKLFPSLERMRAAFEDVAAFMTMHLARNRFHRGLCYAFTVNYHVDRLSLCMENTMQEIFLVTLLAIKQDSQYDGEFRRIRDCQVDKLELLHEDKYNNGDSNLVVQYHSARVDGHVLVIRYYEGTDREEWHADCTTKETPYDRIVSHDRILQELSTVQRSHPNIARVYGWGQGAIHHRFTVFKSGHRSVKRVLSRFTSKIPAVFINWTFKLLDALYYLNRAGIAWEYRAAPTYMIDDRLEPTIGLNNDLSPIKPDGDPLILNTPLHISWVTWPFYNYAPWKIVTPTELQGAAAGCHNELLTNLLRRVGSDGRSLRIVIVKADFPHQRIINDDIAEFLLGVLQEEAVNWAFYIKIWLWANILLALDKTRNHRIRTGLHALYKARRSMTDFISLHGVDEDAEHIVYDVYALDVPDAQRDEIREIMGIPVPSERETLCRYIATGTYHAPA